MNLKKNDLKLYASPVAVITQFLYLPGKDRISNTVTRVAQMDEKEADNCFHKLIKDFEGRHRNLQEVFLKNFKKMEEQYGKPLVQFSHNKQLLLGAFFTKEYSIQAAALFNPSIVPHPNQQGLKPGEQRFVMSLRATGEGHISSIVFQTGIVDDNANIVLDAGTGYFTCLQQTSEDIADTNYDLDVLNGSPINEIVIFPNVKAESMGMEDARFVQFKNGDETCYYATYTAYDGKEIKTRLIETRDFASFKIRSLSGKAIADKGMALFPEKINGKYAMVSRQGGEKINIMFSEDLYNWEKFEVLMEPRYTWELLQLGNCGSPVKTDKGWLLLTHGVGAMRTYVISAILLDPDDPSQIIGRLDRPLIEANETEREGYVPNVVYTCGCLLHGNLLVIPYAVSDSATGFASVILDELLNELLIINL